MDTPPQFSPKHVLCGKDKRLTDVEGNQIFKALIQENVERYNRETEKTRKMRMTVELLEEFRIRSNGGHFYRYCKDIEDWVLCDDGWVRDKVSHALRFQIKRKVRRPKLQRKLSLPSTGSPKNVKKKRGRSESFDSCPAKIESVPMQDSYCDYNNANGPYEDNGESILVDPLILFDEMISSGELDHVYSYFAYEGDGEMSKNVDNGELYQLGEVLTDTEDQFSLNDSDEDDF